MTRSQSVGDDSSSPAAVPARDALARADFKGRERAAGEAGASRSDATIAPPQPAPAPVVAAARPQRRWRFSRPAAAAPAPRPAPELLPCPRNCCPTTPRPSWHSPTARCSSADRSAPTGETTGEVVFNTALTGYQEILTDPSYCRQIVTLTYPHIGNYGTNGEDVESAQVFAAGLVVKDVPARASNFRSDASLGDYLRRENTVGIAGIDTRRLTRHLRTNGAQNGCIVALASGETIAPALVDDADRQGARDAEHGRARPGQGRERARALRMEPDGLGARPRLRRAQGGRASTSSPTTSASSSTSCACSPRAAAASRWCRRETPAAEVLAMKPDGVFLANGPGDPEPCDYAIAATREFIDRGVPTFGICLGHQIMALAAGARTYKMKFGHHGANHPVKDLDSGRVSITSQNHGFAVDPKSLPATLAADPRLALRRHAAGPGARRQAGVLLPGPPGSLARAARHRLPVRPLRRPDGARACLSAPTSTRS